MSMFLWLCVTVLPMPWLSFSLISVSLSPFWLWPVTYYINPARNQWVPTDLLNQIIQTFFFPSLNVRLCVKLCRWFPVFVCISLSTGPHGSRGENHKQFREEVFQVCSSVDKTLASTHKKNAIQDREHISITEERCRPAGFLSPSSGLKCHMQVQRVCF